MRPRPLRCSLLATLLAAALITPIRAQTTSEDIDPAVVHGGYLSFHPDVSNRIEAFEAWDDGLHEAAFVDFKRAARYADKPSQAMLAYMLWNGIGVARDRPRAYAWADLAAERYYPRFVIQREKYWSALSPREREHALEVGQPLLAEYGDAAAKPRLERSLKRGLSKRTGSRTGGYGGPINIIIVGNGGSGHPLSGHNYYQERYWQPEAYWAWQDRIWERPNTGTVTVGPLSVDESDEARAGNESDKGD